MHLYRVEMKIIGLIMLLIAASNAKEDLALKEIAKGNNEFTARLHQELIKTNTGNFIVSPQSIETIMALTSLGTKGETATELQKGLNLPSDPQQIKDQHRALQKYMINGRFVTLTSVNKVYVENGFGIQPTFLETATNDFGSGVENVHFGETSETATKINEWVKNQTNDKIKDLISPDMLDELTRIVLVNALYFKGQWLYQFKEDETKPADFHKSINETIQVDTMQTTGFLRFAENEELGATFVELPYRGTPAVLSIVMPKEIGGLSSLENNLHTILRFQNFTKQNIKVFLPKFKVESSFNLVDTLQNLGVKKLFKSNADLSGISLQEGLLVSKVVQKVFMDLNEKGTEAAAATAVISMARSAGYGRLVRHIIKIDRPFLFFLKLNEVVLFGGRISAL
ncbi:antichymotrypsin-2-like isoform X2 [Harmonia axyridis]|uniref:antichymotrypsin-2-like isoform X2 n=1 Tax=Harmonia axyridis TaxID=115357 RepID=UPI001E275474|nr:antichymotrypsin-2-like isoform X2 [Harmonia axyridis]